MVATGWWVQFINGEISYRKANLLAWTWNDISNSLEIKRLDQENCQEDDDDARSKWCLLLLFFCDIIFSKVNLPKEKPVYARLAPPKKSSARRKRSYYGTLLGPKWSTAQVRLMSRPITTVTLLTGSRKTGAGSPATIVPMPPAPGEINDDDDADGKMR